MKTILVILALLQALAIVQAEPSKQIVPKRRSLLRGERRLQVSDEVVLTEEDFESVNLTGVEAPLDVLADGYPVSASEKASKKKTNYSTKKKSDSKEEKSDKSGSKKKGDKADKKKKKARAKKARAKKPKKIMVEYDGIEGYIYDVCSMNPDFECYNTTGTGKPACCEEESCPDDLIVCDAYADNEDEIDDEESAESAEISETGDGDDEGEMDGVESAEIPAPVELPEMIPEPMNLIEPLPEESAEETTDAPNRDI